jgi:hypothetical protein
MELLEKSTDGTVIVTSSERSRSMSLADRRPASTLAGLQPTVFPRLESIRSLFVRFSPTLMAFQ